MAKQPKRRRGFAQLVFERGTSVIKSIDESSQLLEELNGSDSITGNEQVDQQPRQRAGPPTQELTQQPNEAPTHTLSHIGRERPTKESTQVPSDISFRVSGSDRWSDQRSDIRSNQGLDQRSNNRSEGQTSGQTVGKLPGKTKASTVLPPTRRSNHRSDHGSDQIPHIRSNHFHLEHSTPAFKVPIQVNSNQYKVYKFLSNYDEGVISVAQIARKIRLSPFTTRKIIRRLRELGIITDFTVVRRSTIQGFTFSINSAVKVVEVDVRHRDGHTYGQTYGLTNGQTHGYTSDPSVQPLVSPTQDSSSSSNYIDKLLHLDLHSLYPNLAAAGFDVSHLKQIIENWAIQKIDLSLLPDSLEKADWTLANDKGKIENKLHYILSPLKRGPFATPNGFKSRKVQAIEDAARRAAEEAKRIRELEEQRFEDEFLIWWTALSKQEKEEVDSENKLLPKEGKLRTEFRKDWFRRNVFKPLV